MHLRYTVFENQIKSLIQHCERSELRLLFVWTKVYQKCLIWLVFENLKLVVKQCYQKDNANIEKIQVRHFW